MSTYRNVRRRPLPPAPTGHDFVDLCRGPHVPSTKKLGYFKLTKLAAAYWRGDERRPQLQRMYGTAWESQAALDEYLERVEEAERRDHRRLGAELDLFHFPPEIGPRVGRLPPKGRPGAQNNGGLFPLRARTGRVRVRLHAAPGEIDPVRDFGPSRLVRGGDVPADGAGGGDLLPEADELPDAHPRLQEPPAFLPGAPVAAVRARFGLPLRALGSAERVAAGARHDTGRRPHILHQGAARGRAGQPAGVRPEGSCVISA